MKTKELILFFLLLLCGNAISQVSLDNTITTDNSVTFNTCYLPDYGNVVYYVVSPDPVVVEPVEEKNMLKSTASDETQLYIYSLSDYSLIKQFVLTKSLLGEVDGDMKGDEVRLTQYLFNDDSKIEFISLKYNIDGTVQYVVYNEDMELVQELHGYDAEASEWELINLSDDESSPDFKLIATNPNNCYVYSVTGNPFESKSATPIPNAPQLKSSTSLFTITSNGSGGSFTANFITDDAGKVYVTKTNGQLVQQMNVRSGVKTLPINLQNQSRSIYLITYITKAGNKQTIKVVR